METLVASVALKLISSSQDMYVPQLECMNQTYSFMDAVFNSGISNCEILLFFTEYSHIWLKSRLVLFKASRSSDIKSKRGQTGG